MAGLRLWDRVCADGRARQNTPAMGLHSQWIIPMGDVHSRTAAGMLSDHSPTQLKPVYVNRRDVLRATSRRFYVCHKTKVPVPP